MAKFCMHCGKPLKEGNKFCIHCGKPVKEGDEDDGPVIITNAPRRKANRKVNQVIEEKIENTIIIRLGKDFLDRVNNPTWTKRGIDFWKIVRLDDEPSIPVISSKYLIDIFNLVSGNLQYLAEQNAITSISVGGKRVASAGTPFPWDRDNYLAIIATRKGDVRLWEKEIGYLFYFSPDKAIPLGTCVDNKFLFEDKTVNEVQSYIIHELELLTKPHLWDVVLLMTGKELTEVERSGAGLVVKMSKLANGVRQIANKLK